MGLGYESVFGPGGELSPAVGSTFSNFTASTDISPAPPIVIPANTVDGGAGIRIYASGKFTNTGTPTLSLGLYWGGAAGTKLATTTNITTITAAVNWPWRMQAHVSCFTDGTNGTFATTGIVWMPASLTQFQAAYPMDAAAFATVTVDTTTSKALTCVSAWSAASAGNSITVNQWVVEALNF